MPTLRNTNTDGLNWLPLSCLKLGTFFFVFRQWVGSFFFLFCSLHIMVWSEPFFVAELSKFAVYVGVRSGLLPWFTIVYFYYSVTSLRLVLYLHIFFHKIGWNACNGQYFFGDRACTYWPLLVYLRLWILHNWLIKAYDWLLPFLFAAAIFWTNNAKNYAHLNGILTA